jgi:hypothetical protein
MLSNSPVAHDQMANKVLAPSMTRVQMEETGARISLSEPKNTGALPSNRPLERSQTKELLL